MREREMCSCLYLFISILYCIYLHIMYTGPTFAGQPLEFLLSPSLAPKDMRQKEDWLDKILRESGQDQCIVFVNTKRMCNLTGAWENVQYVLYRYSSL